MSAAAQNARLDYSYRVLEELNLQLGHLRQRTVVFVDAGDHQSEVELLALVKKTAQTLELIDCKGGRLLTEELLALLNAIASNQVVEGIDAAPVLVLASEKLSEYLDYLRVGGLDLPLALLPLLNNMRACRGASLLSEALIVFPVFEIPETSDALVRGDAIAADFFRVVRETKLPLMQCIVRWFRNHSVNQNFRKLIKLLDALEQTSPSAALQDLWLAARALCVSLLDESLEDSVAIRVLFGQMERFVSQLSEADFKPAASNREGGNSENLLQLPSGLFKNMLYYIALSRSTDESVVKLQHGYRLNELLPPKSMLDTARDALGGPNAQLSSAVCASISTELSDVKSVVSTYANSDHSDITQMHASGEKLEQVASTFLLLGIPDADVLARSAAQKLNALRAGTGSDNLQALASDLLHLESAIEEYRHAATATPIFAGSFARDMLEQRRLSSFHYDQIVAACLAQARESLGDVEALYLACMDKVGNGAIEQVADHAVELSDSSIQSGSAAFWQRGRLNDAAQQLHTVKMALHIIPLPELEPLLSGASRFLRAAAKSTIRIDDSLHLAFADLMVNTQTYLDAQILRQSAASDLLGNAETALDVLLDAVDTDSGILQSDISSSGNADGAKGASAAAAVIAAGSVLTAAADQTLDNNRTLMPKTDASMLQVFTGEALEQFELINQNLVRWQNEADPFALQDLRRSYHTLKGSGYVAGATVLARFAAAHECMLASVIDHAVDVPRQVDELMQESAAVLPQLIYSMQSGDDAVDGVAELNARMYSVASGISVSAEQSDKAQAQPLTDTDFDNTSEFHEHTVALGMVADDLAQTSVVNSYQESAADHTTRLPIADSVFTDETMLDELDQTQDLSEATYPLPALLDEPQGNATQPLDSAPTRESSPDEQDDTLAATTNFGFARPPMVGTGEFALADNLDPDSTLFNVFETETRTHVGTLRRLLDRALRQGSASVPDELLPRTLHTLHGSARAAEVDAIANLVSPLEEIAAYRLRTDRPLEISQWTRFSEAVDAIEHNLDVLGDSHPSSAAGAGEHAVLGFVTADQLELHELKEPQQSVSAQLAAGRSDLAEVFLQEAGGLLETIQASVSELAANRTEANSDGVQKIILRDILRPLHTLKGSARVSGCNEIADLAHVLENSLLGWQDSERGVDNKRLELLQESVDALTLNLEQAEAGATPGHFDLLISELNNDLTANLQSIFDETSSDEEALDQTLVIGDNLLQSGHRDAQRARTENVDFELTLDSSNASPETDPASDGQTSSMATALQASTPLAPEQSSPAAASLPVGSGKAVATEQVRLDALLVDKLSSLSTDVSLHHVQLADGLFAFSDTLTDLDKTTTRLREKLRELDMETDMSPDPLAAQAAASMDAESAAELERTVHFNPLLPDTWQRTEEDSRQLSEILSDLDNIRDTMHSQLRLAKETLSHTSRLGSDIHESLRRSRLVRFDLHLHRLGSLVRQTARSLGKRAEIELLGGHIAIDREMHKALLVPLEHLLRNAVAHGIEDEALRRQKSKQSVGKISINVSIVGSDLCVDVSDDGAGVDYAALRRSLDLPGATEQQLHSALFAPGFSTTQQATQISGRGIGLDSTRQAVLELGGRLDLASELDSGTRIRIRIPQRVVINQVVLVEQSGHLFGIPVNYVQQVLPLDTSQSDAVRQHDGKSYSVVELHELLPGFADLQAAGNASFVAAPAQQEILIEASGQRLALRAATIVGYRELITRPPGRQLSSLGLYSGVSVLASGQVALMLDLGQLLEARENRTGFSAEARGDAGAEHAAPGFSDGRSRGLASATTGVDSHSGRPANRALPSSAATVLVVDDSVTMRTYTRRIIEAAGLQCLLARDGLEALETLSAAAATPAAILLDIEMPRMDGFQLLQRLRENADLAEIPVIMISSRTGETNRQKAADLGVAAYLGKPYQASELRDVLESRLMISGLT